MWKTKIPKGSNVFFTSDWHIGHDKSFIWGWRGFRARNEHDDFLVESINSKVGVDDWLFHLGDMFFKGNDDYYFDFLDRLKVKKIYCIEGNHDKVMIKLAQYSKRLENIGSMAEINVEGKHVTLNHYPMQSWNRSHYGTYCLCGHHHGGNPNLCLGSLERRVLDVGVESSLGFNSSAVFSWPEVDSLLSAVQIGEKYV